MNILFVYPNKEGYPIIPIGISLLASILKEEGFCVGLFDATFLMSKRVDHDTREKTNVVEKVDVEKYWGVWNEEDIEKSYIEKLSSFCPDVIAFSIVENNYGFFKKMLALTKSNSEAIVMVGGMMPTVVPNMFSNDEGIDVVCVGEGEKPMLNLIRSMGRNHKIHNPINNLIIKGVNSEVLQFDSYYDWAPNVYQYWDVFDQRHLMKPFMGRMWKTGFFEMSRGCPNNCSYCNNDIYQTKFKCLGNYRREKPVDKCIGEIEYMKKKYSLELVFFNDENFAMMSKKRFYEFCEKFSQKINLPFFIMTRAESLLNEERVKRLKEINCVTVGIGLEVGNEERRNRLLNKKTSNDVYEKCFDICNKYNIRTTANIMIGLPFETKEDILETIQFCRKVNPSSLSLSVFAPYYGTKLREVCVQNNLMKDQYYEDISVNLKSILDQPQLRQEELEELYYNFHNMVYKDKKEQKRCLI